MTRGMLLKQGRRVNSRGMSLLARDCHVPVLEIACACEVVLAYMQMNAREEKEVRGGVKAGRENRE